MGLWHYGAVASMGLLPLSTLARECMTSWKRAEKYQPMNPFLHRPLLLDMEKERPI
jgi:hypothetical protein